jgi:folate-dependent phosphoribosylglycinamide formyltransferase PurN
VSNGPVRPIRVVLFGGAYLDPPAMRFALALERHPAIDLAGVLCQAPEGGWKFRLRERWKRRGPLALAVLLREGLGTAGRAMTRPRAALADRALARRLVPKLRTVPELHAPEVLELVRSWQPDLGAVYGAPILRSALFSIPVLGSFGIHHGRVPDYRGRKTTFWEIYNGERVAGVTIQRIDAGIDTGDVVKSGEVPIGSKGYGKVERETQDLGIRLFVEAILEAHAGRTQPSPQPPVRGRHYGQPKASDFLRLWLRVLGRRLGLRST